VSHQGVTPLHFCKKGAKLVPKCIKMMCFKEMWNILAQPSSMVRNGSSSRTQLLPTRPRWLEWLWRNVLAFFSAENWPSGSPDLNPLDYKLWAVLEDMVCHKHHSSLGSLKRSLLKTAAEIPLETVRAATAEWPERLKACVKTEGGHFMWHYYKWKLNNYCK
jgi:hypothetical protein